MGGSVHLDAVGGMGGSASRNWNGRQGKKVIAIVQTYFSLHALAFRPGRLVVYKPPARHPTSIGQIVSKLRPELRQIMRRIELSRPMVPQHSNRDSYLLTLQSTHAIIGICA